MGASGNLSIISLEKYKWEDIKEEMLNELIECCPNYSDPKMCVKNIILKLLI